MIYEVPSHYFLCTGAADGVSELNAFDQALLDAGVGDTNLVRLSSILPPDCRRVEPFTIPAGALTPVAYAKMTSARPGETIASAVAIGIPVDSTLPGLIMEYHGRVTEAEALTRVREMTISGMKHRQRAIKEVLSVGISHRVESHGAAFAGVVLWNNDGRT